MPTGRYARSLQWRAIEFQSLWLAPNGHQAGSTALLRLRDAALAMPHFVQPAVHQDRGQSFMHLDNEDGALLCAGSWDTNDVYVYDYPSGTAVGTITGNDEP